MFNYNFFLDIWHKRCQSDKKCENGGYMNANCKCSCPPDTKGELCQEYEEGKYFAYYEYIFWNSNILLITKYLNTFASQRLVFEEKLTISPLKCIIFNTWVCVWQL